MPGFYFGQSNLDFIHPPGQTCPNLTVYFAEAFAPTPRGCVFERVTHDAFENTAAERAWVCFEPQKEQFGVNRAHFSFRANFDVRLVNACYFQSREETSCQILWKRRSSAALNTHLYFPVLPHLP